MSFSDNTERIIQDLLNAFGESSMNGIAAKVATSGSEIKASDFQQGTFSFDGPVAQGNDDNFIVGTSINNSLSDSSSGQYFNNLQNQLVDPVSWSSTSDVTFSQSSSDLDEDVTITFNEEGNNITITATYQDAYNGIFTFDRNFTIDPIPTLSINVGSASGSFWVPDSAANVTNVIFSFEATGGDPQTNQVEYSLSVTNSNNINATGLALSTQIGSKNQLITAQISVTSNTSQDETFEVIATINDVSNEPVTVSPVPVSPIYTTELKSGGGL